MKTLIRNILTLCLLSMPSQVCAEEISKAFMHEYENGGIIYIDKKTSSPRSRLSFSTRQILQDNRVIYKYTAHGEGDYDEYKDVTFDIEAQMEEKDGFLYPIYSFNTIKNKDSSLSRSEKTFDYAKQKIYYTVSDSKGIIIKKAVFPMKGITVDSATMVHFLKTFAGHRANKSYKTFYLISDRLELFRINIKDMGIETLELPAGKISAIKLRLIPDLGLLTGIVKSMIPPTFLWYTEKEPYEWLQYEGLETGIGSTHIIAYKANFTKE